MVSNVYDPLQYGGNLHYYALVGGIPSVFGQRVSGKTLPAGYTTEDASLVVGGSAPLGGQLDRNKGIGFGFPLSFKLIDTAHVRSWIQRWTKATKLTASINATTTTIPVSATAGWIAGDLLHLGNETIEIGVVGVGQFTGCTRGVAGVAFAHDAAGVTAYGTDKPRWWRGRSLQVWVAPISPAGVFADNAWLETHAEMIWRGDISRGPRLERDGLWAFEALSIDRKLDRPLSTAMTGEIVDAQLRRQLDKGATFTMRVRGYDPTLKVWTFDHSIVLMPYDASTEGTFYTSTESRKMILDEIASYLAAHAAVAATIDSAIWGQVDAGSSSGGFHYAPRYHLLLKMKVNAAVESIVVRVNTIKAVGGIPEHFTQTPGGVVANQYAGTNWHDSGDPSKPSQAPTYYANTMRSVRLDEATPADVPSTGQIEIDDVVYKYEGAQAGAGGVVFLAGVRVAATGAATKENHVGQSCRFLAADNGSAANLVRNALESSGEAALRGAYDVNPIGYGIDDDAVDEAGIGNVIGSGWLAGLQLSVGYAGRSLVGTFGGLLALSGKALVARQIRDALNRRVQITAVETTPGAVGHSQTITDADLIVDGSTPSVATIPVADAINAIEVKGIDNDLSVQLRDTAAVQSQGERRASFDVPLKDRAALLPVVISWAKSRFAGEQVLQAVKLRVVPWKDVHVGDAVKVDITHFSLWTFSASTPGYTGPARCIARRFDPVSKLLELIMLIDGLSLSTALCPAALVIGFDVAGAPTYIDVAGDYFDHYNETLADSGGTFDLIFVEPGEAEGIADGYTISAVAIVGGNCRLTVSAVSGTPVLVVGATFVTIPESASDTAYQAQFAHADDGSFYS